MFGRSIREAHHDRTAWWNNRQNLRMIDGQKSAVGQMNIKGLEGLCPVHLSQLFNCHMVRDSGCG